MKNLGLDNYLLIKSFSNTRKNKELKKDPYGAPTLMGDHLNDGPMRITL